MSRSGADAFGRWGGGAEAGDEDGSTWVWYVALGSMMNQVGIRTRGVEPAESL